MDELKKLLENAGLSEAESSDPARLKKIQSFFDHAGRIKDGYVAYVEIDGQDERVRQAIQKKADNDMFPPSWYVNNWIITEKQFLQMRIYKLERVL